MPNISTWTNVKVFMSDAPAAAVPASGISKAAEAVVSTGSTTGLSNGDFVLLNAQGMQQVNGRVFRIKGLVANASFILEAEDSTDYDSFSSGSWQKVAFNNTLSTLTTVSASGGEPNMIDTTTIHDNQKSEIPGFASSTSYSFDSILDYADVGLIAANKVTKNKAQRAIQLKFSNGQRTVFYGYVFAPLTAGGSTGGVVTTKVSLSAQGAQTNYPN
jgi:hypothetical protein